MEYVALNNKLECPAVGIGTFMLSPADAENSVREALKMGYRLIDTANAYVNERAVGRGMKDSYYKTDRGYHARSLNSNGGWNVTGCEFFIHQPILRYSNEIRSAVLLIHGEKAHSCYFSKDAFEEMTKESTYAENKELMIIPDAVHTDLYDGGDKDYIPFDKLEKFFTENM